MRPDICFSGVKPLRLAYRLSPLSFLSLRISNSILVQFYHLQELLPDDVASGLSCQTFQILKRAGEQPVRQPGHLSGAKCAGPRAPDWPGS